MVRRLSVSALAALEPGFNSQYKHGTLQPSITPGPGHSMTSHGEDV